MNILPNQFTVSCKADGSRAAGILVGVTVLMNKKNHYFIIPGRTDHEGELIVQKDSLLKEAKASRDLFPSDYAFVEGVEGEFSGKIEVGIPTIPEIDSALRAYDFFKSAGNYRTNFRSELENGRNALSTLAPKRIEVQILPVSNSLIATPTQFETASIPYPIFAHPHYPASVM